MDKIRKRPVILDGDPGHDDAIAWVLAAAADELDIKAITTVAGNQTLEKVTYNARRIAALLHLDIEVAKGRNRPLCSELIIAPNFHGETGLDGPALPEPDHKLSDLSAPEMMAKEKIEMISTMGGGLRNGNWTAGAEFNILVDPEAAYNVYHSGVKLQMCGLDVTEKALVYPEDWERIRSLNNPIAKVVAEWFDFFFIHVSSLGWSGATTHDPCAVLSILHPEIFDIRDYYVDIELNGEYTRGATIADYTGRHSNEPNCACVVDLDREKFVDYLYEACSRYEGWEV